MYINSCHALRLFEDLQSLRKEEVLCDIRLETDDGEIVFGHKVVLVSASPYFHALFTNFAESNKDVVNIEELDYIILLPLMGYKHTGKTMTTTLNVLGLLSASNLFQLDYVKGMYGEFLQMQLNPTNCFGINAFADLYYWLNIVEKIRNLLISTAQL